eukprot:m.652935 g.652935  ORF g.652935 m.652935 type:complete len:305 (+) comp22691_c2_seq16:1377-2291(+)
MAARAHGELTLSDRASGPLSVSIEMFQNASAGQHPLVIMAVYPDDDAIGTPDNTRADDDPYQEVPLCMPDTVVSRPQTAGSDFDFTPGVQHTDAGATVHVATVRADAATDMCSALFDTGRLFRHRHGQAADNACTTDGNTRQACACCAADTVGTPQDTVGTPKDTVGTPQDCEWISTWEHVPPFPARAHDRRSPSLDSSASGVSSAAPPRPTVLSRDSFCIGLIHGRSGQGKSMIRSHYFGPNALDAVRWDASVVVAGCVLSALKHHLGCTRETVLHLQVEASVSHAVARGAASSQHCTCTGKT